MNGKIRGQGLATHGTTLLFATAIEWKDQHFIPTLPLHSDSVSPKPGKRRRATLIIFVKYQQIDFIVHTYERRHSLHSDSARPKPGLRRRVYGIRT